MAMAQSPMVLQFSFLSLTRGREREGRRRIKNSNLRRSLDLDPRPPPCASSPSNLLVPYPLGRDSPPAPQVLQIFSFRIHLVATHLDPASTSQPPCMLRLSVVELGWRL